MCFRQCHVCYVAQNVKQRALFVAPVSLNCRFHLLMHAKFVRYPYFSKDALVSARFVAGALIVRRLMQNALRLLIIYNQSRI
jgi:hypothetical protein